ALERRVVLGCSMGGAIVLKLAAEYQNELRGIVGLESTAYAPGRYNDYLHHPAIHGGEMTASYTYGLCAPQSPEPNTRENWWYYSQAGPGVYAGDVHYYSNDWDGRQDITRIDTRVCKVSLLTGEFDYSCTPEMTLAVAEAIPGSRVTVMKDRQRVLIRAALGIVLLAVITHTRADPDLWGHVQFGRDIVSEASIPRLDPYAFTSDREWINHEWLAESTRYIAFALGRGPGLVVLKMLV